MVVCVLLCVLLGALLNGEATVLSSRVSVEEGKTLILRCTFPGRESAAMQWLTPKGYVTFFNSEKGAMDPLNNAPILGQRQGSPNTTKAAEITGEPPGTFLKDGRFQLIKSSGNRLVVSLSNVTGDDDGVYTCLHYGLPVKSKEVNVTVWAAPSKPLIEVTQITKHPKEVLVLNCSTVGGRPCPRITWLVGHTELSGNRKTTFIGDDDKKCAASSSLRINTFTHRSTVSCVVRHKGFSTGNSTTTFGFSDFLAASQSGTTTRDRTTDRTTGPTSHSAEVTTSVIDSELSSVQGNDVTTIRGGEEDLNTEMTSVTPPKTKMTWEPPRTGGDSENTTTGNQFTGGETSAPGDNTTQQNVTTETMTINGGNSTQNPELQNVTEIDCRRTGGFEASRGKSQSTVILVLVSLMVCVLLVIVHLFLIKLRKAHEAWKKDNENSDQNLESNKSKSNEDTPGPARNGHVTNPNGPGIKYNTQVSV